MNEENASTIAGFHKIDNKNIEAKKDFKIDISKMGVDIDKNEYREIVTSNQNYPEDIYKDY